MEKKTMRAVAIDMEGKKTLVPITTPIPEVKPDECLIKVLASPINPSDEYFSRGMYGLKEQLIMKPPGIPGFEGCGIVEKVGDKAPKELISKKVGFFTDPHKKEVWGGAWAEYCAVPAAQCVPVGDIPYTDCCSMFVNPLTSELFLHVAKERKSKGIVHTAAASSLGKMLVKLCLQKGVELINVVRKPEQEKLLKELGAKHIVNETSPTFVKDLKALCESLGCTVCFDAVAGKLTAKILSALPPKSSVFVYGTLSLSYISDINPRDLLFYDKKIEGFWMKNQLGDPKLIADLVGEIATDLMKGGAIFKPKIAKEIKLSECDEYITKYKDLATTGKTIIRPDLV